MREALQGDDFHRPASTHPAASRRRAAVPAGAPQLLAMDGSALPHKACTGLGGGGTNLYGPFAFVGAYHPPTGTAWAWKVYDPLPVRERTVRPPLRCSSRAIYPRLSHDPRPHLRALPPGRSSQVKSAAYSSRRGLRRLVVVR